MPEKDPNLWAAVMAWFSTVWSAAVSAMGNPAGQGAIMAIIISFLRVLYDAKETSKVRILLESLICGALSLSASSIIEWMDWPPSLSVGAGGAIGFIGVTAIRELIVRFIGKKVDAS